MRNDFGLPILSLLGYATFIVGGGLISNATYEQVPEYALRAFFEGQGWLILFVEGDIRILAEAVGVTAIQSLWLGLTAIFIWRKSRTKMRIALLSIIPVLWIISAMILAYPELKLEV